MQKKRTVLLKLDHLVLMQNNNHLIPYFIAMQGKKMSDGRYFLDTLYSEIVSTPVAIEGEQEEVFDLLAVARETKQYTKYYSL